MIKIYKNYFSSENNWLKNRDKTFFYSLEEVEKYKNNKIEFLNKFYCIDVKSFVESDTIPNSKNCEKVKLFRSGKTSVTSDRSYFYSKKEQEFVEKHHIWKIEKSHNMTHAGSVVWITPRDYETDKKNRIFGPNKYWSTGCQNDTYEMFYSQTWDADTWRYNLNLAKKLNLKFIRTSPSTIETIYYFLSNEIKFECPVILSEETLQPEVRIMAESMFSKVIDKMVCWDGCIGWFECPYGIKHIYDEFCYLEKINGILVSTDLNNFATPFVRYINGDNGDIDYIKCQCGICGSYFKEFYGKNIESLFIEDENGSRMLPGRFISEKLSVFLRLGKEWDFDKNKIDFDKKLIYRIKQKEDLSLEFQYSAEKEFSENQKKELVNFLRKTIWKNKNYKNIIIHKKNIDDLIDKKNRRNKSLFIESDYVKNLYKKTIRN